MFGGVCVSIGKLGGGLIPGLAAGGIGSFAGLALPKLIPELKNLIPNLEKLDDVEVELTTDLGTGGIGGGGVGKDCARLIERALAYPDPIAALLELGGEECLDELLAILERGG